MAAPVQRGDEVELEVDTLAYGGNGVARLDGFVVFVRRGLPGDTQVYCGHEYTAANIRFARTIEPNNPALAARAEEVARLVEQGRPTIPVTIEAEKAANPFLRADLPAVAQSVGMAGAPAAQVFAEIRARKNRF